jgi:ABC-2 type transport system ATP-binding protein
MPAIEVRNVYRRFGDLTAVAGISFDIAAGKVLGFIGANGAGKTTTMRMIATLDVPSAGSITVCGFDAVSAPAEVRRRVGWMPDSYGAYTHVSVWEYLDFFARAYRFTGAERARRVAEVVEFTELTELLDREMSTLSKGMAQRLCLGRALLHDPEVLVLDEPAAGLDPKARIEFKRLVRLLADDGKTLFISSHILSELEEMCDALLFIDDGRIVHHGSAESLKSGDDLGAVVSVRVVGDAQRLRDFALLTPGFEIVETTKDGARLRVASREPALLSERLRAMILGGIEVVEFRLEERRLEDAFVDVLNRSEPPAQAEKAS